jgi:hypothetical protein
MPRIDTNEIWERDENGNPILIHSEEVEVQTEEEILAEKEAEFKKMYDEIIAMRAGLNPPA